MEKAPLLGNRVLYQIVKDSEAYFRQGLSKVGSIAGIGYSIRAKIIVKYI